MTWATYWFIIFIIELGIWAYIAYLHFVEKINEKPKAKYPKASRVIVRTKKDIVRGR
jgi:hypothetical protein